MRVSGHRILLLDRPDVAWRVETGRVDLFLVRDADGETAGRRHFGTTVRAGGLLFGMPRSPNGYVLVAAGVGEVTVHKIAAARLAEEGDRDEIAASLDTWVSGLLRGVATRMDASERRFADRSVAPGEPLEVDAGALVCGLSETPVWIRAGAPATGYRKAGPFFDEEAPPWLPVNRRLGCWIGGALTLDGKASADVLGEGDFRSLLERFHGVWLATVLEFLEAERESERERLGDKARADAAARAESLGGLMDVLESRGGAEGGGAAVADDLMRACAVVARHQGMAVRTPPESGSTADPLSLIATASGFRIRRVTLKDDWWRHPQGPLLAFLKDEDGEGRLPVALLPAGAKAYDIHVPSRETVIRVTRENRSRLEPGAHQFFKPFPRTSLTGAQVLRFGLADARRELAGVFAMGVLAAVLGLLTPVVTNQVVSVVIPNSDREMMMQILVGLLAAAFGAVLFEITKSVALLRVTSRALWNVQAAVWDRLLRMPVGFFQFTSAGDLAARANSIGEIGTQLKGPIITTVLAPVFLLVNFVVMAHHSLPLTLVAVLLSVVAILVVAALGYRQMRLTASIYDLMGAISGLVLQLTSGISKVRVAAAEDRAFARWAERFAEQKRIDYRGKRAMIGQAVFSRTYLAVCNIAIFSLLLFQWKGDLDPGRYMAFNTAFGAYMAAVLNLQLASESLLSIRLIYKRLEPILSARPVVDESRPHPGKLRGRLDVHSVNFRYDPDGPLVLDGVSLRAFPGEFVAITGASGSGKSTLLRVLLGFESPESGSVFYDNQELTHIDVTSLRRQIGVVLQKGYLMPGDIVTNIIGSSSSLTPDDAWEAARLAGIAEDIDDMPMKMHTVVTEDGGTLSGGQKQRLLVARAIAGKPAILMFDEATSALDNWTQAMVSDSIKGLKVTRIVIAHRLSTIMKADRIYVLDKGRVVQEGTFDTLMAESGFFREQAARQLLDGGEA